MSRTTGQGPSQPRARDVLHEIQGELNDAKRVPGALRAVHALVFPWSTPEEAEVQCVQREDLGFLFEVLALAAQQHLDKLDGLAFELERGKPGFNSGGNLS